MKLIAQVKLQPDTRQADALHRTLETANAACNWLSEQAWNAQTFRQYDLHKLAYHSARAEFPTLSSQMIVRSIAKVADAYKIDHNRQRTFKTTGGIAYDIRILRWYVDQSAVSIWTVDGRARISFVCGDRQRDLLKTQRGESDLVLVNGIFYLLTVCDVEEPTPGEVEGVLGVDLGIVQLATDSDGNRYSGAAVEATRQRYDRLKRGLQKTGTKSAKRKLKRISGRERRFKKDTNHVLSKRIVATAKGTQRDIALEDLTYIRERTEKTIRRSQRGKHSKWAFDELRQFITYKAQLAGVTVHVVDPRNSSRTCHVCGCIDKANRKSQSEFLCVACGFALNADHNAAINLSLRAKVNTPIVSAVRPPAVSGTSPRALAGGS